MCALLRFRSDWCRQHEQRRDTLFLSRASLALVCLLGAREVSGQGHTMPEAYVQRLVAAAVAQTRSSVTYDGSYRRIAYPGGDVPPTIGVCTDVIVRAYRRVGVDLQVKVHEDMRAPSTLPADLGDVAARPNIDHRRVPNLRAFFRRAGAERAGRARRRGYRPGDVVTWMLPGNLPHIGIVTGERSVGRPLIVHNIGRGPEVEDMLFTYPNHGPLSLRGAVTCVIFRNRPSMPTGDKELRRHLARLLAGRGCARFVRRGGRAPAGLCPRQDSEGLAALAVAARRAPSPRPGRHPRVLCEPPLQGEALASRLLADDGCASVHPGMEREHCRLQARSAHAGAVGAERTPRPAGSRAGGHRADAPARDPSRGRPRGLPHRAAGGRPPPHGPLGRHEAGLSHA